MGGILDLFIDQPTESLDCHMLPLQNLEHDFRHVIVVRGATRFNDGRQ